jgi:hypothetical protein
MQRLAATIPTFIPTLKTALVGVATTAEVAVNPDWRIVAVNGAVSIAFAIITHFAAGGGRYKSRRNSRPENRRNHAIGNQPKK